MKYLQLVSMPSAVSDWLQEQLEARGIDSVLYTRYVLSLLHSHPVDLIYQDDLRLSHLKKEVGKSNGGRRRSRKSSSDWWRYAQADAEQIKRSAAVECLVSASDQNCEIESLVDELCEKLKEVESISTTPTSELDTSAEEQSEVRKLTPQELAEKYYAAFPPLCPQSPTESKLLALIPKWKPTMSPIKMKVVKKQGNRIVGYENKLHAKENRDMKARAQNKQRLNLISRTKNTISRNNTAFANWDFTIFNRRFGAPKPKHSPDMEHKPLDQCVEADQEIWENSELNIYEDLPVDIKELLDSPPPSDDNVKKTSADDTSKGKKPEFIQYGTNIMSSIWSTDSDVDGSENFNSVSDFGLDSKFSSISIDNKAEPVEEWLFGSISAEKKMKALFEKAFCLRSPKLRLHSSPNQPESDNKQYGCSKLGEVMDRYTFSLMQINHDREASSFVRVAPRCNETAPTVQPRKYPFRSSRRSLTFDKDEDLLTSEKSHFKPITEKLEQSSTQYADGATFVISNKLDKVDYKRSESGTMCIENNQGQKKKYFEYKNDQIPLCDRTFVLKFIVSQNNKACQTEEPSELDFDTVKTKFEEDTHEIIYAPETPVEYCTCIDDKIPATITDDSTICPVHPARPESALGEIWWKYEMKLCEKCNNNNTTSTSADWSKKGQTDSDWDDQGLREIWSGGEEVCEACSTSNAGDIPRPTANLQLREDIIQDGEELFSDLRIVQKNYMEELPLEESPLAEPSIDLTEPISAPPKERKRRHSFILEHQSAWSFASRLEEDCLIQMSTLPTLRSVTL